MVMCLGSESVRYELGYEMEEQFPISCDCLVWCLIVEGKTIFVVIA